MKKIILALSAAALCFSLCACGDININAGKEVADALMQAMETASAQNQSIAAADSASQQSTVAAVQQETPATTPLPVAATTATSLVYTPLAEQSVSNSALYSADTATVGAFGTTKDPTTSNIAIIKHPTSETLPVYNDAYFIAHASNATSITWMIANSDASIIYKAADAPYYISGLSVRGAYSDTLVLENVPLYMNGWKVQAKFDGPGGPVYSNVAYLNVYQVYYRTAYKPCPTPQPTSSGHVPGTGTTTETSNGIIINANNSDVDVTINNSTTTTTTTVTEKTNSDNQTTTTTIEETTYEHNETTITENHDGEVNN